MFLELLPADECKNEKAYCTCCKCGMCGRRFEHGAMVDDGGTHVTDIEDLI